MTSGIYLVYKLVHIVAVVMFLGNIITGLFWHRHAARSRDPRILAHTMAGIIRSDRIFTVPGVLLIILGLSMAGILRIPVLERTWRPLDAGASTGLATATGGLALAPAGGPTVGGRIGSRLVGGRTGLAARDG